MPDFDLTRLGDEEFENLVQALIKKVVGPGTITFGSGPDGGREATFEGRAPYPSASENWDGSWVFQAKFYDIPRVSPQAARKRVLSDLDGELSKISTRGGCDNYILATNAPLSSIEHTGSHDRIASDIVPKYAGSVRNVHVWGSDEISRLLDVHPEIRTTYMHLLTPGDLIAELLAASTAPRSALATTIRLYLKTTLAGEDKVQLDQAGDTGDDLRLGDVYIDLDLEVDGELPASMQGMDRLLTAALLRDSSSSREILLKSHLKDVVLIGGPGEGKSTIGQYVAQAHRATLLRSWDAVNLPDEFVPPCPRIPFRVLLKDYAEWVSHRTERAEHGSPLNVVLEAYLAQDVVANSGRDVTSEDVQAIFSSNPTLVILDGLDEVTNRGLRRLVLHEVRAFLERCAVLGGDLQILATSRPSSYAGEFDRSRFLHLRLSKLDEAKVDEYVKKWISAKRLGASKGRRLEESMKESYADPRVNALMNTPLQVTILIVIVQTGGTPPRQREALFDEYLEAIYKRERAKARWMIRTEKQLLFGLHKYIGYVLHSRAEQANSTASVLEEDDFISHVRTYLQIIDPFTEAGERDRQVELLVREARDRLVLIVELQQGEFGFELRSLQEFFAAAHLVDTAQDSSQRFRRFRAIAPWAHWRNAALFFAGRVGRTHQGEAANILEECRNIDREPPNRVLRRGNWLALELGAEGVFVPDRRLQMSILEYGLEVIEYDSSRDVAPEVGRILAKLPEADLRDLVIPTLERKLRVLAPPVFETGLDIRRELGGDTDAVRSGVLRLAESGGDGAVEAAMRALRYKLSPSWVAGMTRELDDLDDERVAALVAGKAASDRPYFRALYHHAKMTPLGASAVLRSFIRERTHGLYGFGPWEQPPTRRLDEPSESAAAGIDIAQMLLELETDVETWSATDETTTPVRLPLVRFPSLRLHDFLRTRVSEQMSSWPDRDEILALAESPVVLPELRALLWVLRFVARQVSPQELPAFADFVREHALAQSTVWTILTRWYDVAPPYYGFALADLLAAPGPQRDAISFDVARFLQPGGMDAWFDSWEAVVDELRELPEREWQLVTLFGTTTAGVEVSEEAASVIRELTGRSLDEALAFLRGRLTEHRLNEALSPAQVGAALSDAAGRPGLLNPREPAYAVYVVCATPWVRDPETAGIVGETLRAWASRQDVDPTIVVTVFVKLYEVLDPDRPEPEVISEVLRALTRASAIGSGEWDPAPASDPTAALSHWYWYTGYDEVVRAGVVAAATAVMNGIMQVSLRERLRWGPLRLAVEEWVTFADSAGSMSLAAITALQIADLDRVPRFARFCEGVRTALMGDMDDRTERAWLGSLRRVRPPEAPSRRERWMGLLESMLSSEVASSAIRSALLHQLDAVVAAAPTPVLERDPALGLPLVAHADYPAGREKALPP